MYKVTNNVFAGSSVRASDYAKMQKHNITHLIGFTQISNAGIQPQNTCTINKTDSPYENIYSILKNTCDMIHGVVGMNGRVMVHCGTGLNLGPCILIAYLMQYQNMTLNEAYSYIKSMNPATKISEQFCQQLMQYDYELNKMQIV